jgi:TonB-linked SusC/RagA family outer membrane protein
MKKKVSSCLTNHPLLQKTLLLMKLSLAFLFLFLQVSANVRSQDKLTLAEKGISWVQFFDLLQKKSNYTFVYKDDALPKTEKIDVSAVDRTVPQILDNVLQHSPLSYQVLANHLIVVTPRLPEAGDVRISGKVLSAAGDPLPGASVNVKNSTAGTRTDIGGNFSLTVPEEAILVVSYVGYQQQEVPVTGRTQFTIVLQTVPGNMNEVVVIGYGTARKKDLTGAVSVISSSDINDIPVGGIDQILQGKAAGVIVTQSTGAPGDAPTVRIRGLGTINNNDPLYVIDGVPIKDGLASISPNDIESMSVLKDAASATIYGARASNGVVLVTTKKGRPGKPRLTLNGYSGVQTPGHYVKMADTKQYVNAFNIAATNDGRAPIPAGMLDTLPDVDWQKATLRNASQNNVQLAVSGGNENTQYFVSGTYLNQKGMIPNSSYDRFNLRTSVTSTVSKFFKMGVNLNLAYYKKREVGSSGDGFGNGNPGASVMRYALFRTPATPVRDKDGNFIDLPNLPGFFGDGLNPVGLAANTDRNFYNYSVLGDAFIEITPVKNVKLRSDIGTNFLIQDYKQFFPTWGSATRLQNSPNSLAQYSANELNYNWTNTASYHWSKDEHVVDLLAGAEAVANDTRQLSASRQQFVNQGSTFQYLDNGTLNQLNGGNESHWSLFSLFGRVNYAYNDKYLGSFIFRRDGSSRLGSDNRYGNFFAGAVGWRIDKEKFMENVKSVSMLKLRASIGQLGNQEIGNYPYVTTIGSSAYYPFGDVSAPSYTIIAEGNPNVKWETSTQKDAGIDLGLFNNALTVVIDYYEKRTSNMLLSVPVPSSAGSAGSPTENAGNVLNRGFEFEVAWHRQINKNWHFDISANLATVHNEVTSLAGGKPIPAGRIDNNVYATLTTVGQPIGEFYLLKDDGIFQTPLEVFTHAYQGAGIQPGDVKFRDINHDGVIDQNDRVYAGSPIPKFTYGFTGDVSFKQFDLSLFFQGVSGNKVYNQILTDIEGFYRPFNITERIATKSWNGAGSSNEFPRLSWSGAQNNKQPSTRFLENGSYLRLKNLQLGYTLPGAVMSRMRLSSIRVFASIQNVFTITKYTGLDPEMATSANSIGDGVKAVGIDWGTYPSARTFTGGININF